MKKITFFMTMLCLILSTALAQQNSNFILHGSYYDSSLTPESSVRYNDVWGYAITDNSGIMREYALMGSREYVLFLDVTNPTNITQVAALGGGSNTTWRDIKTFGSYAYAVSDGSTTEGLLVFDMTNITGNSLGPRVELVQTITTHFTKCHNIFVDNNGFLYAVGFSSSSGSSGDIIIFDLTTDPANPTHLATLSVNGGYIHDIYVNNHIAYASSGNDGHYIFDMTAVTNPAPGVGIGDEVEIGRINDYQFQGYGHSSWVSGNHIVFADETHGAPLGIADISDPSEIEILDRFQSNLLGVANPTSSSGPIPHNPFIVGNLCYASHYHDGVVVFDISNPMNVQRVGHYDTTPASTSYGGSQGVWGVYPFLPSGRVLGSDMGNGLFVLEYVAALPVSWSRFQAEAKEDFIQLEWATESESNNAGFYVQRQLSNGYWEELGFVPPNLRYTYGFIDHNPSVGTNIYRLIQKDFDGQQTYSSLVSAQWDKTQPPWRVYPNPVSSGQQAFVRDLPATPTQLDLLNLQGQLIQSLALSSTNKLLPTLPAGGYLLRDGTGNSQKLLVK